jgi:DNA-binding beta-propeller fold protein YncE
MRRLLAIVVLAAGLGSCGGHAAKRPAHPVLARPVVARHTAARRPAPRRRAPIVLVTSERRNELVVVDLATGRVLARLHAPRDPENVVAGSRAVLVSAAGHTVSLIDPRSLRVRVTLRRFTLPHIAAVASGFAYVTDDAAGTLTAISLRDGRALRPVYVGASAHHIAVSPDGRRLWVALGESATTIVILDASARARPRVLRRIAPGFSAHDLAFSPDGREVWVTSATGSDVAVLDARSLRVRFRVAVGLPPQHIAFAGSSAYLTSGYGGRILKVAVTTGRVLARATTPDGSFELDAGHGYVVTSSLLRGIVTAFDAGLRRRWSARVGPATRDVAIVPGSGA